MPAAWVELAMRDILLLAVFVGLLPFAVRRTWIAVLLWTWVSIMNPHKLAWGFAMDMPFAAAAAIAAFISLPLNRDKLHFPWDRAVVALILFIVWMAVTTAFAFYPGSALDQLIKVVKIQVMTLVALAAIRERKHIELFVWINALSIGFYGLKGGLFTLSTGGASRVFGPAGGFIEGNNEIGLALIVVIPLMNYLRLVAVRRVIRWALMALMLLSAVAALGTQSRGAFLAIAAMALVLWLRSSRKLLSATFIGALAAALLAFMPDSWTDRMRTIQTYEEDSSAMGRLNAWQMALNLANDRVVGGGFVLDRPEVFQRYAPVPSDVRSAHSIYFQIVGEHGWLGLALFLAIGFYTFAGAARLRREAGSEPGMRWIYHLAGMVQVSMVGYAVGGAFLNLAYFDLPYNLLVVVVACRCWSREQRWLAEKHGAFGADVPIEPLVNRSVLRRA
jgi:putative inorganic carbon (HCO3(-)) transporter